MSSWKDKYVDSHRCEKLLSNKLSMISLVTEVKATNVSMVKLEYDSDYNRYFLAETGEIEYCPFCGDKLD